MAGRRGSFLDGGWKFLGSLIFILMLWVPAGLRLRDDYRRGSVDSAVFDAPRDAIAYAQLEDSLHMVREELLAASGLQLDEEGLRERSRYIALRARVLPFSDPSPARSALWLHISGFVAADQPKDGAVVRTHRLVGRLRTAGATGAVIPVETILDPRFRVKFRCGSTQGILHGTGSLSHKDEDGHRHALLEARHLLPLGDLEEGALVYTAGDYLFPPGFLIGSVVPEDDQTRSDTPIVRASIHLDDVQQAVVLIDNYRLRGAGLRGQRSP